MYSCEGVNVIELQDLLKNLVSLLNDDGLKSKQAAFNLCYDDLVLAKEMASWDVIARHVNEHTTEQLTGQIASNMFRRAKAKRDKNKKSRVRQIKEPLHSADKFEKHDDNKSEINISDDLLEKYKKVCFNNERIALRAIEGDISIDIIDSWKSPNAVRLGNTLTNYISKK